MELARLRGFPVDRLIGIVSVSSGTPGTVPTCLASGSRAIRAMLSGLECRDLREKWLEYGLNQLSFKEN